MSEDKHQKLAGVKFKESEIDFVVVKRDGYTIKIERDEAPSPKIEGFAKAANTPKE